jgi:hypothetical protein
MALTPGEFADAAGPLSWLMIAEELHLQAVALYATRGGSIMFRTNAKGERFQRDAINRSVFLLGGFALENALKAFLVYENPKWVSNGKLARELRSHELVDLQKKATKVPHKSRYIWVLRGFEDGLESWARYPCALSADESRNDAAMNERLWAGYMLVMRAYGARLQRLLTKGWNGPHGRFSTAQFTGPARLSGK